MSGATGERLIAKSTANYRGFVIMEVGKDSFVLYVGMKRHDFVSLSEATAFVDAYYMQTAMVAA